MVQGPVADHSHRLAGIEERLHERDGLRLHPPIVGIHHAARQLQGVEIAGLRAVERHIHPKFFSPLRGIPPADARGLGGNNRRLRAGLIEGLARLNQFHLFEAIPHQDGNSVHAACRSGISRSNRNWDRRGIATPGLLLPS